MRGILPPKYSLTENSQEFDLEQIFGQTDLPHDIKEQFALGVMDYITSRTMGGVDAHGRQFKRYSAKYADWKGVDKNDVNLYLNGDMLGALNYEINDNMVKVYIDGDLENLKSFNHNVGDTLPKREFLAVSGKEITPLVDELLGQIPEKELTATDLAQLREAIQNIRLVQQEEEF
jgi:hypothetical protein